MKEIITTVAIINGVKFLKRNLHAESINSTEEEKNKFYYGFENSSQYFDTFDESLLSWIANKNGVDYNQIFTVVECAKRVLES